MADETPRRFRVAWTADFFGTDGSPRYPDIGMSAFKNVPHIEATQLAQHRPEIGADQLAGIQGVIVLTPRVTTETLRSGQDLLAIGRFGVGYDSVNVAACTESDVVAFITPGAVDRPVAEAVVCWMLAMSHRVLVKDRLVRKGEWDGRARCFGWELRGRTLGVIGLGRIGRELVRLLSAFGMNPPLAFDPLVTPDAAAAVGVRLVELNELMARSDFVSIHCPLNEETRNLIGARELALMRPDSVLINTARGGIVDEEALQQALTVGLIAGACIDCFETEPVTEPHPLGELDNVLLAPHSIAWTRELFRDIGRSVTRGMLDLSLGRRPEGVLNPEVFERPGFQEKWLRLTGI